MENLTREEKLKIYEEMKREEENKEKERIAKIAEYKRLVEETTSTQFFKLLELAENIAKLKTETYESYETILELKEELYGIKDNQQSHTFTVDGLSICIGRRNVDNFDDTVHIGIEKVKQYIAKVTGDADGEIAELINLLLKKDKNGNLKANRVLEMEKIAAKVDDPDLKEGVKIIKEAYKPLKSSSFIEISYRDKQGQRKNIPLTISALDNINWEEIKNETANKKISNQSNTHTEINN